VLPEAPAPAPLEVPALPEVLPLVFPEPLGLLAPELLPTPLLSDPLMRT
jgi:hypothetical protein